MAKRLSTIFTMSSEMVEIAADVFQQENLKIGDVVLIKDDGLPPLKWMVGRIVNTHPGHDGLVKVCSVKTINGILQRPSLKLSPLPINEHVTSKL